MNQVLSIIVLGALITGITFGQVEPRSPARHQASTPVASSSPRDSSSPAPQRLYEHNQHFFEYVLHELNPNDTDWGAWYEERRKALIDASIHNSGFWYSFWVTLGLIVTGSAWVKSLCDRTRQTHIMGDQMNKVRDYAAYSRRVANEAILRYNTHIELCNRAIEVSEAGHSTVLGGNSAPASPQAELAGAKDQIGSFDGDKRRLEAEVAQKSAVIADLSLRVDALSNQLGGNGQGAAPRDISTASQSDLVRHINTLQQQLRVEREKNKRLKGGA